MAKTYEQIKQEAQAISSATTENKVTAENLGAVLKDELEYSKDASTFGEVNSVLIGAKIDKTYIYAKQLKTSNYFCVFKYDVSNVGRVFVRSAFKGEYALYALGDNGVIDYQNPNEPSDSSQAKSALIDTGNYSELYVTAMLPFRVSCAVVSVKTNQDEYVKRLATNFIKDTTYDNRIYFLGDSLTEGNGSGLGLSIVDAISRKIGSEVYNLGIGGAAYKGGGTYNLHNVLDGLIDGDWTSIDNYLSTRTPVIAAFKQERINVYNAVKAIATRNNNRCIDNADVIYIAYGTNDWLGNVAADNESDPMDTNTACGSLRSAVQRILTANPFVKILVVTPGYCSKIGTEGDSTQATRNGINLLQYGEKIKKCCEDMHIPCFESYKSNGINTYNASSVFASATDGVHLKGYGYELVSCKVAAFIRNNI